MAARCIAAIALACAALCPSTLAAEDAPQTGTIEVEVVYKESGEPVEGVCVAMDLAETQAQEEAFYAFLNSRQTDIDGRLSFDDVTLGTHKVSISNPVSFGVDNWTRFRNSGSELEKTAALSAETPAVRLVFEVARGVRLHGSVTRQNGSPVAGACVVVNQGEQIAHGTAGDDGHFEFLGLETSPVAQVRVHSTTEYRDLVIAMIPIHEEDVVLGPNGAKVDLVVQTAPINLTLVVLKPVWPFSRWEEDRRHALLIWSGGKPEAEVQTPDARIPLDVLQPLSTRSLASNHRTARLRDVAVGQRITVGLGTWYTGQPVRAAGHVRVPAELHYRCWRTVEMTDEPRDLRLTIYEPYARLSRAVAYGAPALLILAICVPLIIRQVRKHRRARPDPVSQGDAD